MMTDTHASSVNLACIMLLISSAAVAYSNHYNYIHWAKKELGCLFEKNSCSLHVQFVAYKASIWLRNAHNGCQDERIMPLQYTEQSIGF